MARSSGFKEHSFWGACYASVVGISLFTGIKFGSESITFDGNNKDIFTALILATVGFLGAVLPDIDSSRSTSKRMMFFIFLALSAYIAPSLGYLLDIQEPYVSEPSASYSVFIAIFAVVVLRFVNDALLKHRGITHSVPGVFLGGALLTSLLNMVMPLSTHYLIMSFVIGSGGVLVHLIVDYAYGSMPSKEKSKGMNPFKRIYSIFFGKKEGNMNHTLFVMTGSNMIETVYYVALASLIFMISNSINKMPFG